MPVLCLARTSANRAADPRLRCAPSGLRLLAMGRTGFPQREMDAALARVRRTYVRMDSSIAVGGGPWLLGADITLADVALMPAIVRLADLGLASGWADLPRVQRW